jgi:hypothetical protein
MLIRRSCIFTASRPGRYGGPRGAQSDRESNLPARQLPPVAARTRRYRARHVAEPQWARTGLSRCLDDALCAAGSAAEATVRVE